MAESSCYRTIGMFWSSDDQNFVKKTGLTKKKDASAEQCSKTTVTVAKTRSGRSKTTKVKHEPVTGHGHLTKLTSRKATDHPRESENAAKIETRPAKASLKDLCFEDKTRVASLIKELTRLGEEKETIADLLQKERELFEERIQDILNHQEKILEERSIIEKQLHECQKLIAQYQDEIKKKESELRKTVEDIAKHKKSEPGSVVKLRKSRESSKSPSCFAIDLKVPDPNVKRPFTTAIDQLIQEERNKSVNSSGSVDRLEKLGPLINPNFESTQVSESDNKTDELQEFKPLHSEYTSVCNSNKNSVLEGSCPQSTQNSVTFLPEPANPVLESRTNAVLEDQYKAKNEEMKQVLDVQKQALILEQERLKVVLAEQEALLVSKQHQLWKQQELQRERLRFFEQAGYFPSTENHVINGVVPQLPDQHVIFPAPHQIPNNNLQSASQDNLASNDVWKNTTHQLSNVNVLNSRTVVPYDIQPNRGLSYGGLNHQPQVNLPYYSRLPNEGGAGDCNFVPHTTNSVPNEELELINSFKAQQQYPSSQKMRPAVLSRNENTNGNYVTNVSQKDKVDKLLNIVNEADNLYEKSSDVESLQPYLIPTTNSSQRFQLMEDNFQEFDEVTESLNNFKIKGKNSASVDRNLYKKDIQSEALSDSSDELEESQVLEDVFFIK